MTTTNDLDQLVAEITRIEHTYLWSCPACAGDRHQVVLDLIAEIRELRAARTAHAANPASLQRRAATWRQAKYPDSTPFGVFTKLVEEVGEIAKAMVGLAEHRRGRGDVNDEAAQVVLVLLSLVGWFYPDRDLLTDVVAELERQGG